MPHSVKHVCTCNGEGGGDGITTLHQLMSFVQLFNGISLGMVLPAVLVSFTSCAPLSGQCVKNKMFVFDWMMYHVLVWVH